MEKRHILLLLLCLLVACNTLVTLNMDIAIVSMVNFHDVSENLNQSSNVILCPNTTFFLRDFLNHENKVNMSFNSKKGEYNWSKKERSTVLSGYYWLNYLSILPASILAQKFGSKRVVGFAQGLSSVMSSLIPIFAGHGYLVVAWIRAIQGLLSFMSIPAGIFTIVGNWIPPQERGRFGAAVMIGASFGYAVGNFCFGYIAQYTHWHNIFHMTSICAVIWLAFWYMLVYDEPQTHPTITLMEQKYIETSLQKFGDSEEADNTTYRCVASFKDSVPWKDIITSIPVIVSVLAINSGMWYFVLMATYLPVYLKTIYGLSSEEIGIITSAPLLVTCVITFLTGYISDYIIKNRILAVNMTRKICAFIGGIVATFPLIVMALTKCDINVIITCIPLCFWLRGCMTFGPSVGLIDMSPKFCGILEGITGTSQSIIAFLFTSMINYLSGTMETEDLWRYVFILTASFAITVDCLYLIFGSAKLQSWNFDNAAVEKK